MQYRIVIPSAELRRSAQYLRQTTTFQLQIVARNKLSTFDTASLIRKAFLNVISCNLLRLHVRRSRAQHVVWMLQ